MQYVRGSGCMWAVVEHRGIDGRFVLSRLEDCLFVCEKILIRLRALPSTAFHSRLIQVSSSDEVRIRKRPVRAADQCTTDKSAVAVEHYRLATVQAGRQRAHYSRRIVDHASVRN